MEKRGRIDLPGSCSADFVLCVATVTWPRRGSAESVSSGGSAGFPPADDGNAGRFLLLAGPVGVGGQGKGGSCKQEISWTDVMLTAALR